MFEESLPTHKVGVLLPLSIIDNAAYEFYRIAPPGIMQVMIPIGLAEFSPADVERALFKPLASNLDKLMERGVEMVVQSGTPLPILIGVAAHDRMIEFMTGHAGVPASSTVLAVGRAAKHLGVKKMALVNKWSVAMNRTLGEFLAREGVTVVGAATKEMPPSEFQKINARDHMQLAYELGRQAFLDNPDCDAIYLGGGTWIAEPVAQRLEAEFGRPALCNVTAQLWDILHILKAWTPIEGHGRLLATA
ncbi:MAG: maleate isomerase [Alphaproteobacteria bacterium]|jgi:maleate cis-trans isomerase|nr:maleate isomerase [Alphaproteobacteria bacterium]